MTEVVTEVRYRQTSLTIRCPKCNEEFRLMVALTEVPKSIISEPKPELATENQKSFMRKLGIPFGRDVSKQAASILIDDYLTKRRERKSGKG